MATSYPAFTSASIVLPAAIAALASSALAQSPAPQPFVVTEPQAIQAAEALFEDLQSLAQLVTPCVESGRGTAIECVCGFPAQLGQVQRSVRSVQAQYPEWRTKIVNWTDPATRQSRAISLEAVARQSSPRCPAK